MSRGLRGSVSAPGATVFQQPSHQSGPTRLMAGPEPSAGLAVKVFVKEHQVATVGIRGETLVRSVTNAPTMFVGAKIRAKRVASSRALPEDS